MNERPRRPEQRRPVNRSGQSSNSAARRKPPPGKRQKRTDTLSRTRRKEITKRNIHRKKTRATGFAGFIAGVIGFIDNNKILVLSVVAFILFAAVALILILNKTAIPTDAALASPTEAQEQVIIDTEAEKEVLPENYNKIDEREIDADILAGLAGENTAIDHATDETPVDAQDLMVIGVIKDTIDTSADKDVLQKIEEAALSAKDKGEIDAIKFYDSNGNSNQQIQDIRNLINAQAKAVIIDVRDKNIFTIMTGMANKARIPVVAINAPVSSGYDINVVVDDTKVGEKSGEYIVNAVPGGNYWEIAIDKEDTKRFENINTALKSNPAFTGLGITQTEADKLTETINNGLEDKPGIIISPNGYARKTLQQLIDKEKLPQLFSGDNTAGFIKLAYALLNEGAEAKTSSPTETPKKSPAASPSSSPTPKLIRDSAIKILAESPPSGIGGLAFEFAVRLAKEMQPKPEAFPDKIFTYSTGLVITNENLSEYYEKIKDKPDSYKITEWPSAETVDSLFE